MSQPHPRREDIIAWLRTLDVEQLTGKPWRLLFDASYSTWSRNATAWKRRLGAGGTYTLRAIIWYQHVARPGSTDSRPGVILAAIAAELAAARPAEVPS